MRDRLIEIIKKVPYGVGVGAKFEQHFCEKVADKLIENGIMVLPCKVGDLVYTNVNGTGLQNSFRVNSVDLLGFSNGLYSWTWHQLGKSVFLTLEEAQQALKGGTN